MELLLQVRYQIQDIGGSRAQRDLWNLLLIRSAMDASSMSSSPSLSPAATDAAVTTPTESERETHRHRAGSGDTAQASGGEDCAQQAGKGGHMGPGRDIYFYSKLVEQLCNERHYAALPPSKRGTRAGLEAAAAARAAPPLYDCAGL